MAGHWAAVSLLIAAGLGVTASLVFRPPSDVPAAARRLALGLALMFTLAPDSRWGYFIYPAGLLGWLVLTGHGRAGRGGGQTAIEMRTRGAFPTVVTCDDQSGPC
jgi:hypothetical protein